MEARAQSLSLPVCAPLSPGSYPSFRCQLGNAPHTGHCDQTPLYRHPALDGHERSIAALAVPTAIQFMLDNDWEKVRSQCHLLLRRGIERICDLTGLLPLYLLDSDFCSQMGIAPLPPSDRQCSNPACMLSIGSRCLALSGRTGTSCASPFKATTLRQISMLCWLP
jgi:hypothetical protein